MASDLRLAQHRAGGARVEYRVERVLGENVKPGCNELGAFDLGLDVFDGRADVRDDRVECRHELFAVQMATLGELVVDRECLCSKQRLPRLMVPT